MYTYIMYDDIDNAFAQGIHPATPFSQTHKSE